MIPANVTPYDKFFTKLRLKKQEKIRVTISTIFKIIGAAAAAANLLLEFKIPEKKDDRLTKKRNGNVILVSSTARLNFVKSS